MLVIVFAGTLLDILGFVAICVRGRWGRDNERCDARRHCIVVVVVGSDPVPGPSGQDAVDRGAGLVPGDAGEGAGSAGPSDGYCCLAR